VHNSGALPASYVTITSFPTLSEDTTVAPPIATVAGFLRPVVIAHAGHVGGTLSLDTRDSDWDKTTISQNIAENWAGVKATVKSVRTGFGTNTSAIDFVDAFVSGATGIFIFGL
jgi:hypothetical protein